MSDRDLRAIYQYIKSLGLQGQVMPAALPPGQEPRTAYILMEPVSPRQAP